VQAAVNTARFYVGNCCITHYTEANLDEKQEDIIIEFRGILIFWGHPRRLEELSKTPPIH